MAERQLNLYSTYTYTNAYFNLNEEERKAIRTKIVETATAAAEATFFYSIFPTRSDSDILIWSGWGVDEDHVASMPKL